MTKLIKTFEFRGPDRVSITFSDVAKIHINSNDTVDQQLQLKLQDRLDSAIARKYSLDTDLTVTTALTNPTALKGWLGFEARGTNPTGTTTKFRFDNGVRKIYWNGSGWVTATLEAHFSTEAEIDANITTLPFTDSTRATGIEISMVTTDATVTPTITELKLLGEFDIDVLVDVITSLMSKLFDELRPRTEMVLRAASTTNSFDFSTDDYKLKNQGYNITNVVSIYDRTVDPLKMNNLKDTYTPGALNRDGRTNADGTVTTTSPITSGNKIEFEIEYVPEISIKTEQDFYEVNKVPSFILERVEELDTNDGVTTFGSNDMGHRGDFIRDRINDTAIQIPTPSNINLQISFVIFTKLIKDQYNMTKAVEKFIRNQRLLTSLGLDEPYNLQTKLRMKTKNRGNRKELAAVEGSFLITNIPLFDIKPAVEDIDIVRRVKMDFDATTANGDLTKRETVDTDAS